MALMIQHVIPLNRLSDTATTNGVKNSFSLLIGIPPQYVGVIKLYPDSYINPERLWLQCANEKSNVKIADWELRFWKLRRVVLSSIPTQVW